MAAGAVLVAVLALLVEAVLALVQRLIVSPGLRGGARRAPVADRRGRPRRHPSGRALGPPTSPELAGGSTMKRTRTAARRRCGRRPAAADRLRRRWRRPAGLRRLRRRPRRPTRRPGRVGQLPGEPAARRDLRAGAGGQGGQGRAQARHRQPRGLLPGLKDGSIDLVPEYTGELLQYFDQTATESASEDVYAALQGKLPGHADRAGAVRGREQGRGRRHPATATAVQRTSIEDLGPALRRAHLRRAAGVPDPARRPPGHRRELRLHVQGVQGAGRRRPADRRRAEGRHRPGGGPVHHRPGDRGRTASSCWRTRRTTSRRRTSCR